jgi:O-antigen ligase
VTTPVPPKAGLAPAFGVSPHPATPWLLLAPLAGFVLLLPFGRSAEAAILAALLIAITLAVRERARWLPLAGPLLGFLLLLWCYVQPALISAFDSLDPAKSWQTALSALRYAGLGAIAVLWYARAPRPERLLQAVGLLLAVWWLDALVQALSGVGLRGASAPDRLSGIFGADNLKLGPTLVALAPVGVAAAALHSRKSAMIAALLLLPVLLLSGARAAWISAAVLGATGVHLLLGRRWRRTLPALSGLALLGAMAIAGLAQLSPVFAERLSRTTAMLALDRASIDYALADRLPIFEAAARMAAAHPVNGVGVRAFQEAYPAHTVPGDKWLLMGDGSGATHAHHLLLEIVAETGLVGLLCWLLGLGLLWRYWHDAEPEQRRRALPWLLGLLAMTFPLNTHLAFYSSYWSGVFFWLLALASAALLVPVDAAGDAHER